MKPVILLLVILHLVDAAVSLSILVNSLVDSLSGSCEHQSTTDNVNHNCSLRAAWNYCQKHNVDDCIISLPPQERLIVSSASFGSLVMNGSSGITIVGNGAEIFGESILTRNILNSSVNSSNIRLPLEIFNWEYDVSHEHTNFTIEARPRDSVVLFVETAFSDDLTDNSMELTVESTESGLIGKERLYLQYDAATNQKYYCYSIRHEPEAQNNRFEKISLILKLNRNTSSLSVPNYYEGSREVISGYIIQKPSPFIYFSTVDAKTTGGLKSLRVSNLTVSSFASDDYNGGAVISSMDGKFAEIMLSDVRLIDNVALRGGAVSIQNLDRSGIIFLNHSLCANNFALFDGGCVYISNSSTSLKVSHSDFEMNTALKGNGGDFYIAVSSANFDFYNMSSIKSFSGDKGSSVCLSSITGNVYFRNINIEMVEKFRYIFVQAIYLEHLYSGYFNSLNIFPSKNQTIVANEYGEIPHIGGGVFAYSVLYLRMENSYFEGVHNYAVSVDHSQSVTLSDFLVTGVECYSYSISILNIEEHVLLRNIWIADSQGSIDVFGASSVELYNMTMFNVNGYATSIRHVEKNLVIQGWMSFNTYMEISTLMLESIANSSISNVLIVESKRGGGIDLTDVSNTILNNMKFVNTTSKYFGGGAVSITRSKQLHIDNIDCFACQSFNSNGGCVVVQSSQKISLSNIGSNQSSALLGSGADVYISGSMNIVIVNASFIGGHASYIGGSVAVALSQIIVFKNIYIEGSSTQEFGGGMGLLNIDMITWINVTVRYATSRTRGGGIYIGAPASDLTFVEVEVENCRAGENGGGIYIDSGVTGQIYFLPPEMYANRHHVVLGEEGQFSFDFANQSISDNDSMMESPEVEFVVAIVDASSAEYVDPTSDCYVIFNDMQGTSKGYPFMNGVLPGVTTLPFIFRSSSVSVYYFFYCAGFSLTFIPIYSQHSPSVVLSNNVAGDSGGGIYVFSNSPPMVFLSAQFVANEAIAFDGGAMKLSSANSKIMVMNSTFVRNRAGIDGGAIHMGSSQHSIQFLNCKFIDNVAVANGGALYLLSYNGVDLNKLTVPISWEGCNFEGNEAKSGGGGAIFMNHQNVANLKSCYIANNAAVIGNGGGVLLLGRNTLRMEYSNVSDNSAPNGCGGGIILGDSSNTLILENMAISENKASNGGGLCVFSLNNITFIESTVFSGNRAEQSGGAMGLLKTTLWYSKEAISASFGADFVNKDTKVSFIENVAERGSAIFLHGLQNKTWSEVNGNSGRDMMDYIGVINAVGNSASRGSTIFWVYDSTIMMDPPWVLQNCIMSSSFPSDDQVNDDHLGGDNIGKCYFSHNIDAYGDKIATQPVSIEVDSKYEVDVYDGPLSKPIQVTVRDYYGHEIISPNLFQIIPSLTSDHECLETSRPYLYGSDVTTEGVSVVQGKAEFQDIRGACYPEGEMTIQFSLYQDPLGGMSGTSSSTTSSSTGVFTTAASGAGIVSRSTLTATSSDGYNLHQTVRLSFRSCRDGEYISSDGKCLTCPSGSYSLHYVRQETKECVSCFSLPGVVQCHSNSIQVAPGYWRRYPSSQAVMACVGGGELSCLGGTGTGEELCNEGYEGPLCGTCSLGYYKSHYSCIACSRDKATAHGSGSVWAYTSFVILLVLLLALLLYVCHWCRRASHGKTNMLQVVLNVEGIYEKFVAKLKITVATYQVIVASASIFMDTSLPYVFVNFTRVFAFVNLDLFTLIPIGCFYHIDFIKKLLWVTLSPLIVTMILGMLYWVESSWLFYSHRRDSEISSKKQRYEEAVALFTDSSPRDEENMEERKEAHSTNRIIIDVDGDGRVSESGSDKDESAVEELDLDERYHLIQTRYLNLFFYLTYFVLPSVTTSIFQLFVCVSVDPNGEDDDVNDRFLAADVSISCDSDYYRRWLAYGYVMIVVYPIGTLLVYFFCLMAVREEIHFHIHSSPSPSAKMNNDSAKVADKDNTATEQDDKMAIGSQFENTKEETQFTFISNSSNSKDHTEGSSNHKSNEDADNKAKNDDKQEPPLDLKEDKLSLLKPTTSISKPRRLSPFTESTRFLWSAYKSTHWYWEIVEAGRRILLTAVLSICSTGTVKQQVLAAMLAFTFLLIHVSTEPYDLLSDHVLAATGLIQIFLTYFATIIFSANLLGNSIWVKIVAVLLIIINLMVVAMLLKLQLIGEKPLLEWLKETMIWIRDWMVKGWSNMRNESKPNKSRNYEEEYEVVASINEDDDYKKNHDYDDKLNEEEGDKEAERLLLQKSLLEDPLTMSNGMNTYDMSNSHNSSNSSMDDKESSPMRESVDSPTVSGKRSNGFEMESVSAKFFVGSNDAMDDDNNQIVLSMDREDSAMNNKEDEYQDQSLSVAGMV